jgi:hypothetical protein
VAGPVDLSSGIVVLQVYAVTSSNLSAGKHPLRRLCNLPRTSAAECHWNLKAAPNFKQRDNVFYRNTFDEPKSGRCNVHCSLCAVERIRFIGAARSQLSREFRGVLSTDTLTQNPCPIMFGICGVSGILSRCELRRKDAVATIRATCSEGGEDPKAGWVPHLPSHVHNFADSEQRGGEGGTGAPTSCEQSYHAGSLRSGGYAEQKAGTKQTCSDGAQQGRSTGLTGPNWTMIEIANSLQVLERNGGDDETRTRDLCRDSVAWIGFTTTYKNAGTAKIPVSRTRHHLLWVGLWVGKSAHQAPALSRQRSTLGRAALQGNYTTLEGWWAYPLLAKRTRRLDLNHRPLGYESDNQ